MIKINVTYYDIEKLKLILTNTNVTDWTKITNVPLLYQIKYVSLPQATLERVNNLKKSPNFSPVFNMLVPEVTNDVEMKENVDTNNVIKQNNVFPPTSQAIGTLSKQLSQMLQSQLESVVETVRQFRDQKYAEFEAYRERAQRDHKILSRYAHLIEHCIWFYLLQT